MQIFNADIIKLLNSKKVCWYPSSGADINSINFWRNGYGNLIIPEVFIFTDNAFIMTENFLSIAENDNMIDTLKGYGFIKTHYEEIEDVKNFRHALINNAELLNKLDLSVMRNYIIDEQTEVWNSILDTMKIGLANNSDVLKDIKFLNVFNNHFNEILNHNNNLINNDVELSILFSKKKLCFKNEQLNTELVFLNIENDSFYNKCIEHRINIPCFQLRRPYKFSSDISRINVQEAIVGNNDLHHISNKFTEIYSFRWVTHYFDDFAKMIRLD